MKHINMDNEITALTIGVAGLVWGGLINVIGGGCCYCSCTAIGFVFVAAFSFLWLQEGSLPDGCIVTDPEFETYIYYMDNDECSTILRGWTGLVSILYYIGIVALLALFILRSRNTSDSEPEAEAEIEAETEALVKMNMLKF